jgi:RHS repeat-associated protein
VYAGGSTPVAMIKGGATFRILTDTSGNVRLVVNAATGTVAQRLDYDTFGNVVLDSSPGFQPFGFAGGLYDHDTGLVRFGARDYDAATGRWTAKDAAGFAAGDKNLYRYALNDPVNRRDVTGLDAFDLVSGFAEDMNANLQMMANPFLAIQVLVDAGVRLAAVKLGVDPRDPVFFGVPPPGYDHVPTMYETLFRPPTIADRTSADYALGEFAADCVGIALGVADLAAGAAEGASKLSAKVSSSAAARAADELAQEVAERAATKAARAAAPEAKGPGLYWIRPEGGGAGTRGAGKAAGGFFR